MGFGLSLGVYLLGSDRGGSGQFGLIGGGPCGRSPDQGVGSSDEFRIEFGQAHRLVLFDFKRVALLVELNPPVGIEPKRALGGLEFAGGFAQGCFHFFAAAASKALRIACV